MSKRYKSKPGVVWKQMDVRDMRGIEDKSVEVAFDKGTLDAMIHGSPWSPPPAVKENTNRYLSEVHRILKDDGVFLYVTFCWIHQYLRAQIQAPGSVPIYWKICISDLGYIYWLQSPVSVQIVPQFNQSIQPYFLLFYLQHISTLITVHMIMRQAKHPIRTKPLEGVEHSVEADMGRSGAKF